MKHEKKIIASVLIALTVTMLCVASIPPAQEDFTFTNTTKIDANPKFVFSSWEYPDEYGQGILSLWAYENSTGSWETVGENRYYYDNTVYDWNASVGIKLSIYTFLNSSKTGAVSTLDGRNHFRHNVTVTNTTGTVFTQQNITYFSVSTVNDPMWLYHYYIVLGFLPTYGNIYTVTITHQVFYNPYVS